MLSLNLIITFELLKLHLIFLLGTLSTQHSEHLDIYML